METQTVYHPLLGSGILLKTYMGGVEWEVQFDSGHHFRLPAREFSEESRAARQNGPTTSPLPAYRTVLETDQFRARQTLEALRVGIVPLQDAETLTIGLEAERVTLDRVFQRSQERSGDVLAVIGDYGFGKSHFIELAARRGLRDNFVIAGASLDLVEVPPSRAHKIYEALVASLRYPDTHQRGLRPLLQKALAHPNAISEFVRLCPREAKDCPLASALLALQDCPSESAFEGIVQWLSGRAKASAQMKTCLKKPPRLYVAGETARQYSYLLTGISLLSTLVGYSGLAVMIDESEHYSLLRPAQRERADSFFKAMIISALGLNNGRIDARGIPENPRVEYPIMFASEPHLLFLFALTESAERMPVGTWLAPSQIIRLDDRFIEKDIREFFVTLLRYHALAYTYVYPSSREGYAEIVDSVPGMLSRSLGQHRINLRELIRTAVTVCDMFYLYADYVADALLADLKQGLKM